MSKGKPRNTRGAISDLYLSELAGLSPDERENRLVYGDTLAGDFADHPELAFISQAMSDIHDRAAGRFDIKDNLNGHRPSNPMLMAYLRPMLSALENHDADFFHAIARLVKWHEKHEPKNELHIALTVLRNRDGLKSGTMKEIEDGLTKLRVSGEYSKAIKLPDRKTTKAACERVGIEVLKDLPGRR